MTDLPPFTGLYRELSELYDVVLAIGEDHLRPSPARRAPRRDPDERKTPVGSIRRPTEETVFDARRLALADARTRALTVLEYVASRLPEVRENLSAAHREWLGERDSGH